MNAAFSTFAYPTRLPAWLQAVAQRATRGALPDPRFAAAHVDRSTSLLNTRGFEWHGNLLLESCRAQDRPLSLVVLDCADLLEVREIYGTRIAREVTARTVARLKAAAGSRGFAARTGMAEFCIVLPGFDAQRAQRAVGRAFGQPARVEFDAGEDEIVMVPNVVSDIAGTDTASIGELRGDLRREIDRDCKAQKRRHRIMQLQREYHSRPMAFASA